MATTEKEFLIRVRADIDQALKDLKKLPKEIAATGTASKKAGADVSSMGKSMQFLTRAAVAYFSVRTVTQLIKQTDAYNVLNVRIKTATKETGDYVEVQRELFRITQQNGAEFATTVSLFQGLARSAPELKATNSEMLRLVNTVEQLGIISGASQAAQRAGLLQFSQGLAGGVFRAEEFNSILENLPEIATRLAKGMGLSVGELRKMVLEGKLLSKDVFDALLKQSEDINDEFEDIPDSVERSANRLSTSFAAMLSQLDKASGTTSFIARLFSGLSTEIDDITISLGEDDVAKLELELRDAEKLLADYRKAFMAETGPAITETKQTIVTLERKIQEFKSKGKTEPTSEEDLTKLKFSPEEIEQQKQLRKAEQDRVKSLVKLNTEIAEQGKLYGKTAEEVALYKLQQLGASDAEIKAAQATFATIDAQRQFADTKDEVARIFRETRTEAELLAQELNRLNKLYEGGDFGTVGSEQALDLLTRSIAKAKDEFKELEESGDSTFSALVAATRGWGDEFTNTLADMVQRGKLDFSSLADSIINDLLRIGIFQGITAPLFGGLGIPGFSAPVQHAGGAVGTGPTRVVNPMIFAGAKRYHTGGFPGLSSDEVPIIAQKGELVLSKKQVANMGTGGGGSTRIEMINRGSPSQVTDSNVSADVNGQVISIIIDDLNRGGRLRDSIKTVSKE